MRTISYYNIGILFQHYSTKDTIFIIPFKERICSILPYHGEIEAIFVLWLLLFLSLNVHCGE